MCTIRAENFEKRKEEKDNRVLQSLKDFMTRHDVSSRGKSKNSGETRNEHETTKEEKKKRPGRRGVGQKF